MKTETRSQYYKHHGERLAKKIHGRPERKVKEPGSGLVRKKTTYRIKARSLKDGRAAYAKTRTSQGISMVRRLATIRGFNPERVKV